MSDFERITRFRPAFDKRSDDPRKDYGIGNMVCYMVLKGPKGAVHFIWSTGILLPETTEEYARAGKLNWEKIGENHWFSVSKPMGYDVGYHALEKHYENQEVHWPKKMVRKNPDLPEAGFNATREEMEEWINNISWEKIGDAPPNCEWLGVPCYTDGSALRAEEWLNVLIREGSDKIWEMMEQEYKDLFEETDAKLL